ncbi:MAG: GNAT family N-acetyltransferase, partial [Chloroflexota bacterium]
MDSSNPGSPIINISGEKVALGPYSRELMPLFQRWLNDFEVTRYLSLGLRPMTLEAEEKWYDNICKSERDVLFVIYDRATMHPIGGCGLHDFEPFHRTAEFGIF